MDFFRSVFSADTDILTSQTSPRVHPDHDHNERGGEDAFGGESRNPVSPENDVEDRGGGYEGWNFGGLIKTFASKSEFIIQTYRRDLAEFSSGLKEETSAFREIAARAVRDLPGSFEVGASLAQESLESAEEVIDDLGGSVWRGTAGIISQSKEVILSLEVGADSGDEASSEPRLPASSASSSRIYSRYEKLLLAIQLDVSTFSEDPEDTDDFSKWRSEFDLAPKAEMENLCNENDTLDGFLNKLVPSVVDYDSFWCRYFYKVHKLKQAEDARSKLVKRVISREAEEDLSWDVDDEDEGKRDEKLKKEENPNKTNDVIVFRKPEEEQVSDVQSIVDTSTEQKTTVVSEDRILEGLDVKVNEKEISTSDNAEESKLTVDSLTSKLDETVLTEGKTDSAESSKGSEFSIISSQNSLPEEDDLGWDEIEDLPEDEEKKSSSNVTLLKVSLHKRLSAAEEDEDLSWDIDDEPIKP